MGTALNQGSAMVGERASGKARQAEPGHGTAVLVRPRGDSAGEAGGSGGEREEEMK